jgi:hypothetical protein
MTKRRQHIFLIESCVAVLLIVLYACAPAIHPNAVSQLDSTTYDALITANAAINQAKADVAAGTLPASATQVVNDTVAAYNTARGAWLTYRHTVESLAPGAAAPAAETAALEAALSSLTTAITNLQNLIKKGGKKP